MGDHIRRPAPPVADDETGGKRKEVRRDRETPSPEGLLQLLADPNARTVMALTAEGPRSVEEIVERCEMSPATAYRKVNQLAEAGLVTESVRIRPEGTNFREFELRVGAVRVTLTEDRKPDVTLEGRSASAPVSSPPVSTDGGTTQGEYDEPSEGTDDRQERFRELFTEVTGTEEVTETRDVTIQTRYIDNREDGSVSQYVTSLARDDGLSDTLSDPEN